MRITVKAPAKINLSLDILAKREDGLHEISTVLQTVSLCDHVTVEEIPEQEIIIECSRENIPCGEGNLCHKAARAFFERFGISCGVRIIIDKKIPAAAGLAGGSADAAAALMALSMLCDRGNGAELSDIAASIGADVPFCLNGGTALAVGTGTRMRRLHLMPQCDVTIIKPPCDISTAEAYSLFDSESGKAVGKTFDMIMALHSSSVRGIASAAFNGFEQVIKHEDIGRAKDILLQNGALCAVMSGSGSSVFGIFGRKDQSIRAAEQAKNQGMEAFAVHPVDHGCTVTEQDF